MDYERKIMIKHVFLILRNSDQSKFLQIQEILFTETYLINNFTYIWIIFEN